MLYNMFVVNNFHLQHVQAKWQAILRTKDNIVKINEANTFYNWRNFKKFQFTKIQKNEFSAKYITGLRRNALASIIIYFIILACMILGGLFFIYDIKEAIFIFFLLSMGLIIYFVRNYRKTNLKLFFLEFKDNNFNHKLETLNQVMRDIVNHPERGAVYFNQNHKLLLWNKAYEKLFNFQKGI